MGVQSKTQSSKKLLIAITNKIQGQQTPAKSKRVSQTLHILWDTLVYFLWHHKEQNKAKGRA